MSKVEDYKEQITAQMDVLQEMMENNLHLKEPQTVIQHLESLAFKWSFISEEDKEYIQCAQYAIEEEMEWNV